MEEKDLGLLADSQLTMTSAVCPGGQDASWFASIRNSMASGSRVVIIPLYSALEMLHLLYCVQFGAPHCEKEIEAWECVQRKAKKLRRV